MATSSGKKGKKTSKKNKLSLGEFLTDGNSTPAQVKVAVPLKLRDWADEADEDEDDRPVRTQLIALPTAPRATRLLSDDTVPHHPPFQAFISNLPYDMNENELHDFFDGMEIASLRLPRDDNDTGRLRGFGYIEFAKRQDLIDALSIPEPVIHGRRIKIDLSSEKDNRQQRNNNRYNDNYGGDPDRPMGNWRDGPRVNDREQGQRRPYNNYNRDRGDRGDSDRERYPDSGADGNWRLGDRPVQPAPDSPPSNRRGYDRGNDRGGDRGFRRGGDRSGDRGGRREMEPPMERPKLVLQPRTLPLPEKPKPEPDMEGSDRDASQERRYHSGSETSDDKENRKVEVESRPKPTPVPAAKVFGDAKPVDTAARLKEIEERMQEKQRQEREERQKKAAEAAAAVAAAAAATASSAVAGSTSGDEDGKEKTDPSKDESENRSEEKTEKKPAEVINWRVRNDDKEGERRGGQSPSRRYSPTRKFNKRNDNRDSRDIRDRNMSRDNRNMRDNRRDYNRMNDRGDRRDYRMGDRDRDRDGDVNRGGRGDQRGDYYRAADNRERRENARPAADRERDREQKPIEERMPKFQEPAGPNLSVQNTYDGLSADEIDD
ncbi:eukaryotic translation initiation factor 4B-like isoform X2 [Sabethes cyaneus]|uniref:eukaryotic translation initiation factor 4B-like isoform X2 n=1 Tax=Sabethes cyaneus TaxID=53552 RepID=UPI00237D4B53|nr:eukaryotic translation initiation factor 4B-like isoform X2 [Sabethes cyaneus]